MQVEQRRAGRDPGAAVNRNLAIADVREREPGIRVQRARDAPRDRVDRLDLAAPALGRARVEDREARVAEPLEQLFRVDRVALALARRERGGLDLLLARAPRATPVDDADRLVAEMAQQPPEPP